MIATPNSLPHPIGRKQFDMRDQELFASLSSDRNPMHMDAVSARRLLTGRPVVHGIHVLITALSCWKRSEGVWPVTLDCTFNNPVNVDDVVEFSQRDIAGDQVQIEASVQGLACAKLRLTTARADEGGMQRRAAGAGRVGDRATAPFQPLPLPMNEPPAFHLGRQLIVPIDGTPVSDVFDVACRLLGAQRVMGLLNLSYFVGMVCPGLNSIFASVQLRLDDGADDADVLRYTVERYDDRFGMFQVSLAGVFAGRLTAFVRPPPQVQPTTADIARWVDRGEFRGTRSLVIGASRGLGETTAKILAAGGGHVILTYLQGLSDIGKVQVDIDARASGSCAIVPFDITSRDYSMVDFTTLDAIYVFATPRIYRKKSAVFVRALFDEFVDFYIASLHDLCVHLEALPLTKPMRLYVPSSVFIAERPDGLAEYAMAKAAAEVLAQDINRHFKNVSILTTRLPKLSTDQTSSILNASTADNLAALLPVVRTMARPAST